MYSYIATSYKKKYKKAYIDSIISSNQRQEYKIDHRTITKRWDV